MKPLSELKISPAPWGIYQTKKEVAVTTSAEGFGDLDSALCRGPRRKSNARLIAASPKLYAKAWELITAFDERVMSPGHIEALRAALAEAAGEEVRDAT